MRGEATKNAIINATINLVAEKGLEGFSIGELCKAVDISRGTMYSHYESKEEMLYDCFLSVNKEIAELFNNKSVPVITSKSKLEKYLHDLWIEYFNFMLANGNKSLFYYAYRESENIDRILMRNNESVANEMAGYNKLANGIFKIVAKSLPMDYIMVHIIDGTGIYVKHILRNHANADQYDPEQIWTLLYKGLKGIAK